MTRFALGLLSVVTSVAAFFWVVGDWTWGRGWAFLTLVLLGQGASLWFVWRRNPELIRCRARIGSGTKRWDRWWLTGFAVLYLAIWIVGALDHRIGWSTMSPWWFAPGSLLYLLFVAGITWSMVVNPHFEKTVRIQIDRDHRVIDSGPYAIVRHPGYAAMIPGYLLPAPLLLGSWWAFLPAVSCSLWLVLRTVLEDRTLLRELSGYEDYAGRVRYRLWPGLW